MKTIRPEMTYRKLRAPKHSGQCLLDPATVEIPDAIVGNRCARESCKTDVLGLPVDQLARQARNELINAARDFTSAYQQSIVDAVGEINADTKIILSGHQPRLFHPGVWFKNFVLHQLAHSQHAVGINLIVDNDLAVESSIRVPTGTAEQAAVTSVAFDDQGNVGTIPFEERNIYDKALFDTFAQRVAAALEGLVPDACVDEFWQYAIAASEQSTDYSNNLGLCLSQARHRLEADLGLETLEVPLSHICDGEAFSHFAAFLIAQPDVVRQNYNDAISAYRRIHRLRSASHPAPKLRSFEIEGQVWMESPFWVWSKDDPQRDPLFVCDFGSKGIILRRGDQPDAPTIELNATNEPTALRRQLKAHGWKLRPRALITTTFARVFLSDLFVHGIGGSKYDQVTDQLIYDWFEMAPPEYLTATATVHLPIARALVDADELRRLHGMLRELKYHPETMLSPDCTTKTGQKLAELKKKKKKILRSIPPRGQKKSWNDELQRINTLLSEHAQPIRSILQQQRVEVIQRVRNDAVLSSREFAFCLFPKAKLARNLLDMLRSVS